MSDDFNFAELEAMQKDLPRGTIGDTKRLSDAFGELEAMQMDLPSFTMTHANSASALQHIADHHPPPQQRSTKSKRSKRLKVSRSDNNLDLGDGSHPSAGPSPKNGIGRRHQQLKPLKKQRNTKSNKSGPKGKSTKPNMDRKQAAERLQIQQAKKAEDRKKRKEQRQQQQQEMRAMMKKARKQAKTNGGSSASAFEVHLVSKDAEIPISQISGLKDSFEDDDKSRRKSSLAVGQGSGSSAHIEAVKKEVNAMKNESGHSSEHHAERLRMELENIMGFDKFFTVYQQIQSDMAHGSFEMTYLSSYLPSSLRQTGPTFMKLLLLEQDD